MRRRAKLVKARVATFQRIDALVELLGPAWAEVIGAGDYTKTALVVLERYGDPRALRRLGQRRLAESMIRTSKGAWREAKAGELLAAAADTIELWAGGGIDFAELAADIAAEVRVARSLSDEIAELEARMVPLFAAADRRPAVDDGDERGIIASVPGLGGVLGAGILARFGDLDRFATLAAVRSFTGLVPKVDQCGLTHGHSGLTKAGDPGLREALYLAADYLRHVDPQLAARYHRLIVESGKHHDSALCHLATTLATRLAACWRHRERTSCATSTAPRSPPQRAERSSLARYKIPTNPSSRRRTSRAKQLKQRSTRRGKESTNAAPALWRAVRPQRHCTGPRDDAHRAAPNPAHSADVAAEPT